MNTVFCDVSPLIFHLLNLIENINQRCIHQGAAFADVMEIKPPLTKINYQGTPLT
jgi:hypothetical protein